MGAPRIGTRVIEGTRAGVVVDHRPQGMVDVCFEDSGLVERRPEGQLLSMNPAPDLRVTRGADGGWYMAGTRYATQTAATKALSRAFAAQRAAPVAPKPRAVRAVAAEETRVADVYDPTQEQFRAVVQGVYESLVTKELGVKAFKDARGARADTRALKAGGVAQEDLRKILSRAYAIATRQGQKHGYLEAGTQRPTKKGAALAAARYGADPKLVSRMLAGDSKAQKLAAAKDVAKLAENRQDYEITLQLVRKGQAPRVVEEIVGGKLVSFQQPGGKVSRRTNARSWEERGMASGAFEFPSRMRPLLEEARKLGIEKGQALRQLAQAHKESANKPLFDLLANIEIVFRNLSGRALDLLGLDALDDVGLPMAETRRALLFLRKTYEDIASEVQRGRPIRNPVKQRTKGIGIKGVGYHWGEVRTGRKSEFTPVVLYATSPANDPQGVGFFSITFPPGRRDVERALQQARGWEFDPTVSATAYTTGIATSAPQAVHKVLLFQGGGAGAKRGVGGQFGKGLYTVVGPRVPKKKDPPLFERKADAEAYAKGLDLRLFSFEVEQLHEVWDTGYYFEVRGPLAEEEIQRRIEDNKRRGERGEWGIWNENLLFDTEVEAQKMAESLDRKAAKRGALPIKGYRTKRGLTGAKAAEAYRDALARLDENKVFYKLDSSVMAMEKPTAAMQKRLSERSPERLVATAVARGEDVDVLLPLITEAEQRGFKKLANLLSKSYEEEATAKALKAAAKKLGPLGVAKVLKAPRDETSMKARMPGGFVQSARMFGPQRRVGFKKQASDLDVLLAALYPGGDAPPTLLPKYERTQLLDMDEDALRAMAKQRLGLSDKEIEKVLTSEERRVLSKIVAEQAPASGVELVERGGFDMELPKATRRAAEAVERARRKLPKPLRPEALREAAQKATLEERIAEKRKELAEQQARIAALKAGRKTNGAFSTGLRVAKSGGALASRYGKQAYSAARAWVASSAGQKFVGEVASIAVALFGARAVSSGTLTREQAALVQRELERKTGRTADPARVAVALQIAGE